tara:strand:- start:973 stop:1254 length:282 start_codon:yes stop_codon:yes gene_type:complete
MSVAEAFNHISFIVKVAINIERTAMNMARTIEESSCTFLLNISSADVTTDVASFKTYVRTAEIAIDPSDDDRDLSPSRRFVVNRDMLSISPQI